MSTFWITYIAKKEHTGEVYSIAANECILSLEKAIEMVNILKEQNKLLLAIWVDEVVGSSKTVVYHDYFVDTFGYIKY